MLSDEEIIAQIRTGSDDDSVRWIVQLVDHDRAYLPILLRLLREVDRGLLRIRIPMALGKLGIASDEVLESLIHLCKDNYASYPGVRDAAQKAMATLASQNINAIGSHLEAEDQWWGAEICAQALAMTRDHRAIPLLVRALQRFPDNYACLESLLNLAGEQSPYYILAVNHGITAADRGKLVRTLLRSWRAGDPHTLKPLQYLWWHLSAGERQSIEAYLTDRWFHDWPFHPVFEKLFHGRFRDLMQQSRSDEEALARLSQVMGFQPLYSFFNLKGIDDLTSLRVDEAVTYEDSNLLRFAALVELATTREGSSIERIIDGVTDRRGESQRLLEQEQEYDHLREDLALLRRQLQDLLAEEAVFSDVDERIGNEVRPGARQAEIDRISEQIKDISRHISHQGEGPLPALRKATERLLPALREYRVSFKRLDIEGVLGEYDFVERKVTLYPPMIELAARDLVQGVSSFGDIKEVIGALRTVVDIHETAHASLHLGKDSDGRNWSNLTSCSVVLHEGLAQFYTYALIKRVGDKKLLDAFESLSRKQPEEYGLWSLLASCSLEKLRRFILAQRSGERLPTILDITAEAMRVVAANREWIRSRMGDEGWQAFVAQVSALGTTLRNSESTSQLATACNQFLNACDAFPAVRLLLSAVLADGFPSEEDRCLLQMAAICQKPPAPGDYSRTTLRAINLKVAMMVAPLSPEEQGIANTIIEATRIIQMRPPVQPKPQKNKQKRTRRIVFAAGE